MHPLLAARLRRGIAVCLALPAAALTLAPQAGAGPATDAMANCLVMNTTGADRVTLIRWVIRSYAVHPAVADAVSFDAAAATSADVAVADLLMALLTERCPEETRAAFAAEKEAAFAGAFTVLGQVAAQELATDPSVNAAMTGFLAHVDQARLMSVLQ